MKYRVIRPEASIQGHIYLQGSKSITNRVLIIKALCDRDFDVVNYSESQDTLHLVEAINSSERVIYAGDGGTTYRFLTAFLAIHEGEVVLNCSEQMKRRPVADLVNALRSLGAEIDYVDQEGYPPLRIRGKMLTLNKVEVPSDVSSQFVSALLLIAPRLKNGLVLKLKGEVVSRPYIDMTLKIMKHFGVDTTWAQNVISIPHQKYVPTEFKVEGDWSAASYFYAMAAMAKEADITLHHLHRVSSQGDAVVAKMMEKFGVKTIFQENGVRIVRDSQINCRFFENDFTATPDLAPTLMALCSGLNIPAHFSGIKTLRFKETDRIAAMQQELEKLEIGLMETGQFWSQSARFSKSPLSPPVFDTYKDHRMAMSLATLCMAHEFVEIHDPAVVMKSYPTFWQDLSQIGCTIHEKAEAVS